MKKFLVCILSMIMVTFAGCGGENSKPESATEKTSQPVAGNDTAKAHGKVLVAYFSRADDNYNVGVIEKGNTKIVAEMIAAETGADMFEIKPAKPYPADYRECTEVAKTEKESKARPEIVGKVENFSDYDIIFLGYPIWWSDLPMAVYTFLEQENFADKKIVPFCTHEGSGLGATEKFISEATHAEVLSGFALQGSIVQNDKDKTKSELDAWLKKINF